MVLNWADALRGDPRTKPPGNAGQFNPNGGPDGVRRSLARRSSAPSTALEKFRQAVSVWIPAGARAGWRGISGGVAPG